MSRAINFLTLLTLVSCAGKIPIQFEADSNASWSGFLENQHADELQLIVEDMVYLHNVPGVSVSLVTGDGTTWNFATGHQDAERIIELNENSLFQIGSATKTFTAVEVMLQVEEGRLSLDDTLDKWYPEYPRSDEITVDYLLSHRSGIEDIFSNIGIITSASMNHRKVWDISKVLSLMSRKELLFEPGSKFSYSNTNYLLLGGILKKITGRDIHTLFKENIFDVVGMNSSYLPPGENRSDYVLVSGIDYDYLPMGPTWMDINQTSWTTLAYSAGGAISSTKDLLKFYKTLFEGDLLSAESKNIFFDIVESDTEYPEESIIGYKYGLSLIEVEKYIGIGHRGGVMGYDTTPIYFPEKDIYIVIITNQTKAESSFGLELCEHIISTF